MTWILASECSRTLKDAGSLDPVGGYLESDDFRACRQYLPNEAFTLSEGSWGARQLTSSRRRHGRS